MHTMIVARWWLVLVLLGSAGWHGVSSAQDAVSPPPAIAPSQASQVLEILKDDKKRAELEQTLSVIAAATGNAAAVPATDAAEADSVALARNGLMAQVFSRVGIWMDSTEREMRSIARTALQVGSVSDWWREHMGTPEARTGALAASWATLLILGLAWAVQLLVSRALKRWRLAVAARAASRYAEDETRRSAQLTLLPAGASPEPAPADASTGGEGSRERHLSLLRRVPYALANCVLELLPLAGFLIVTTLLLTAWGGPRASAYEAVITLVGAYAAVRLSMSVVRLLLAPSSPSLRLTRLKNDTARHLHAWIRRIVVTAVIGTALTEVALQIGATAEAANLLAKLVALAVHVMLIILVVQSRHAVAAWIRQGRTTADGYSMRSLLAEIWAPVAIFVIAAMWVIWTLGVTNGFQQLLHYLAWTVGVVLLASVVSILALGALDRAFFGDTAKADVPGEPQAERPAHHYYHLLVQRAVSFIIVVLTIIALLQAWGLDALSWFQAGTVGRRVAGAAMTVGTACALAILAWESVNVAVRRKIDNWTRSGDTARAVRLRTLVPILRTILFIMIALIVLFTALNELGINIAPLLAGASIIGVALGFGSQKLVQDFITGIFLLMENAMQVGDFVTVAGLSGSVEHLSIRTVRLRAGDGSLHVVPFSSVGTVTNTNRGIGNASVRVSVRADADIDAAIRAIKEVGEQMRHDPALQDLILADLEVWGVDQVDGATVTLAGQIRTVDRGRWPVQREFNRRVLMRFRELGIRFSNPQETVFARAALPQAAGGADSTRPAAQPQA